MSGYCLSGVLFMALVGETVEVSVASGGATLIRDPVRFAWADDRLVVSVEDRALAVSLGCPMLLIGDERVTASGATADVTAQVQAGSPVRAGVASVALRDQSRLEVETWLQWSPHEAVLRKWARLRVTGARDPKLLVEVVLEDLPLPSVPERLLFWPHQSYPVFYPGFFAGIEFPAAATRIESGRTLIAHQPGVQLQPDEWFETRRAVFGVTPLGLERQTFQDYVLAHRPPPNRFQVDFDSWHTLPYPFFTESDALALVDSLAQRRDTCGVTFDVLCLSLGWSNPQSIWEEHPEHFPDGFGAVRHAVEERAGSRLGLWVSPSGCYGQASDNEWAHAHGYETFELKDRWPYRFTCIAGKRFRDRFRDQLLSLVERYDLGHFYFDGLILECPASDHGHAPGVLSGEAAIAGFVEVAEALRRVKGDIWLQNTGVHTNPSPWWQFYFNSVLGSYGEDAPFGRVPAPVHRESYTTARDFFCLQGAYWNASPLAGQETLGFQLQSTEPFMNDLVMCFLRGNLFVLGCINTDVASESDWRKYAAVTEWARTHAASLIRTEPLLPLSWQDGNVPRFAHDKAAPREPYGYAHGTGSMALVALRNPWIEPAEYGLQLGESIGLAQKTDGLSVVSLYPEPRVYGAGLTYGDRIVVPLCPYELVVLQVTSDPIAAGTPAVESVTGRGLSVDVGEQYAERVRFAPLEAPFGPDYVSLVDGKDTGIRLRLQGEVSVATEHADALVLLEGPSPVSTPLCEVAVNGERVETRTTDSETGWASDAHPEKPENWLFVHIPLVHGRNALDLQLTCGGEDLTISAWVWGRRSRPVEPGSVPNVLPSPEGISLDAIPLVRPVRSTELPEAGEPLSHPVSRAPNGIYLDCMDSLEVEPGGGLSRRHSAAGDVICIGGQRYTRSLQAQNAPVRIRLALDQQYRRFQSWVGAGLHQSSTAVVFEVLVDGEKRWDSGLVKRREPARRVDLDVTGARALELSATPGTTGSANQFAEWAEARLLR